MDKDVRIQAEAGLARTGFSLPHVSVRQARTWPDVWRAYRLLYEKYIERGLIQPNTARLRFTRFNLLPRSATLIAADADTVVGTLSVILDSDRFGLPMDEIYRVELQPLRWAGRKLAEVSGLAIAPTAAGDSLGILLACSKLIIQYALRSGVTDLLIACHPKHARFYRRLLLLEPLGECRSYGSVNGAPAVALQLDLTRIRENYRAAGVLHGLDLFRYFFSDEAFACRGDEVLPNALGHEVCGRLFRALPHVANGLHTRDENLFERLTGGRLQRGAYPVVHVPEAPAFLPM